VQSTVQDDELPKARKAGKSARLQPSQAAAVGTQYAKAGRRIRHHAEVCSLQAGVDGGKAAGEPTRCFVSAVRGRSGGKRTAAARYNGGAEETSG
jgi:hypothetical protein